MKRCLLLAAAAAAALLAGTAASSAHYYRHHAIYSFTEPLGPYRRYSANDPTYYGPHGPFRVPAINFAWRPVGPLCRGWGVGEWGNDCNYRYYYPYWEW